MTNDSEIVMVPEIFISGGSGARSLPRSIINVDVEEILSLVGDGVASVDNRGVIVLLNRAAEELFGYVSAEVLGRPINVLIPARFHDRHRIEIFDFVSAAVSAHRSMGVGRKSWGYTSLDASLPWRRPCRAICLPDNQFLLP